MTDLQAKDFCVGYPFFFPPPVLDEAPPTPVVAVRYYPLMVTCLCGARLSVESFPGPAGHHWGMNLAAGSSFTCGCGEVWTIPERGPERRQP